ncbi:MAG: sugar ABC transporter permease [Phycisphaeraceae bacterium]|nr:sugar ABC transporter permease [Phycisphaeraceae bacterium]
MPQDRTSRWTRVLAIAVLVIVGATMLLPLLWMISTSLKAPGVPKSQFLPGRPTLEHYRAVFSSVPFARFFFNSLIVAVVVTVGQVTTSALAAFAFARLRFRGRDLVFLSYLGTMMIPTAVTMVPLFMIFHHVPSLLNDLLGTTYFRDDTWFLGRWYAGVPLGVDSYTALIAPALFSAYGTFMLRQFFLNIPRDLEDAAQIDGCSLLQIFRWVIVPLSKPALATLAVFTFMNNWRNFLWPLVMTNAREMQTLPVGLATFMDMYGAEWSQMMAGAVMMLVPMIIVFLFCQRWFISGIQLGAVKG